jgi:hypothetical protein
MRDIDDLIEKKTGLSIKEAMSIDDTNLYKKLGEETFWKLSTIVTAKTTPYFKNKLF